MINLGLVKLILIILLIQHLSHVFTVLSWSAYFRIIIDNSNRMSSSKKNVYITAIFSKQSILVIWSPTPPPPQTF